MRTVSLAFGLLMVAAATVQSDGPARVAAAVALVGVLVGLVSRVAATLAVVATAVAVVLSGPSAALAAIAGLAAAVYLILRHTASLTVPTIVAALGVSAGAVLGATIPLGLPWVPLVAPLAVVAIYVTVLREYVG
jgi:hypothetical protein